MIDIADLNKYHLTAFKVMIYSDKQVWISGKQTVNKKYPDGSLHFSHIEHNLKGESLQEVLEELEKRAKAFYETFNELK
jgi:hypothetical protein